MDNCALDFNVGMMRYGSYELKHWFSDKFVPLNRLGEVEEPHILEIKMSLKILSDWVKGYAKELKKLTKRRV